MSTLRCFAPWIEACPSHGEPCFSADETADVGIDNQTPVAQGIGIGPETRFTGKINKITLEVKGSGQCASRIKRRIADEHSSR